MARHAGAPSDMRMHVSFLLNPIGSPNTTQQLQHNSTSCDEIGTTSIQNIRHLQSILQQNSLDQLVRWEQEKHREMYIQAKAAMTKVVDHLNRVASESKNKPVAGVSSSFDKTNTKSTTRKERFVFHHYIQPPQRNGFHVKTISFDNSAGFEKEKKDKKQQKQQQQQPQQKKEEEEKGTLEEGESTPEGTTTYQKKKRLGRLEREILEGVYLGNRFPTKGQVKDLALELDLSTVQIRNWFNYKRSSERRIVLPRPDS